MKKLKKLMILFTAALFCLLPIFSQPLTAQASTPTTYYVKYNTEKNDWYYQVGSSWDDTAIERELYYMTLEIKDGDVVIVDGAGTLNLNVSLSNLTILNGNLAIVTAKSYDEVHVLSGVGAAINGDIKNAHVYDNAVANINNNVTNLYAYDSSNAIVAGNASNVYVYDSVDPIANVECLGTVDHVKTYDDDYVYYEYYNFAKSSLKIENGSLRTEESKYSKTAPAATTPAAPSTGTTTTPPAPADELDDVPKTGDFSVSPVWFLAIAVVCMLGYIKLERR